MQRSIIFTVRGKNIGKHHNIHLIKHFHSANELEQDMFGSDDDSSEQFFCSDDTDSFSESFQQSQSDLIEVGEGPIVQEIEIERCSICSTITLF
ncbi:hypothetical protein QTN25_000659 [Entamoeba marina]